MSISAVLFHAHRCVIVNTLNSLRIYLKVTLLARTVHIVFGFWYTKEPGLTNDNLDDVLSGAEFLHIDKLKANCIEFMNLSVTLEFICNHTLRLTG